MEATNDHGLTDEQQRALDAMVDRGWPSVTFDGSYWFFDHVGELHQVRSVTIEHSEVTIGEFRRRYEAKTGKRWRG